MIESEQDVKNIIQKYMTDNQFGISPIPYHIHDGVHSQQVSFKDLIGKVYILPYTLFGTQSATAGNYSTFFTVPYPMVVQQIQEDHAVAGTDGSAVTLNVEKLTGTTAPGSGTALLSTGFDLKGTINTVKTGTLTNTLATKQLAIGDRLALKLTGTPTAVANVNVVMLLSF